MFTDLYEMIYKTHFLYKLVIWQLLLKHETVLQTCLVGFVVNKLYYKLV